MQVRVTSHRDPEVLDMEAFERLARFVLEREEVPDLAELSLALVDPEEMAGLNERFRGVDDATDVLSFGCDDPCAASGGEPIALGDVVIAPAVAAANAAAADTTVEAELDLLLVHGILHLLGYEHESDEGAAVMQSREAALLDAYHLAD